MRKLLAVLMLFLALPVIAAVPTTTISGKVLKPDGMPASSGVIQCELKPVTGTVTDQATSIVQSVGAAPATLLIDSTGTVTGKLIPNDVIIPANTWYSCTITLMTLPKRTWPDSVKVATSATPISWGSLSRSIPTLPAGSGGGDMLASTYDTGGTLGRAVDRARIADNATGAMQTTDFVGSPAPADNVNVVDHAKYADQALTATSAGSVNVPVWLNWTNLTNPHQPTLSVERRHDSALTNGRAALFGLGSSGLSNDQTWWWSGSNNQFQTFWMTWNTNAVNWSASHASSSYAPYMYVYGTDSVSFYMAPLQAYTLGQTLDTSLLKPLWFWRNAGGLAGVQFGIGNINPQRTLDVTGDIGAQVVRLWGYGGGTYNTSSVTLVADAGPSGNNSFVRFPHGHGMTESVAFVDETFGITDGHCLKWQDSNKSIIDGGVCGTGGGGGGDMLAATYNTGGTSGTSVDQARLAANSTRLNNQLASFYATATDLSTLSSTVSTHIARTDNPHSVTAAQAGAIPTTQKGAANGVPTLDSGTKIPIAQIPDAVATDTEVNIAATTAEDNAKAASVPLTQKGAANGVPTLGSDTKIPDAQIPDAIARDTEVAALDAQNVKLTGNQTIAGNKTFSGTVTFADPGDGGRGFSFPDNTATPNNAAAGEYKYTSKSGVPYGCTSSACTQLYKVGDALPRTDIYTFDIDSPVTGDSGKYQFMIPANGTITRLACSTNVSTSTATINLDKRAATTPDTTGTSALSAGLVCDTNQQTSCGAGCDVNTITSAAITANTPVALTISAVANTPTVLRVFITVTTP